MTTYLDLTNRLLRRINEAVITESDWDSVRGIQATAKDAILDTVRKINNRKNSWPFNAVEHTQTLTTGQEEYPWPLRFISADWDSFEIQKDDDLGVVTTPLRFINREQWYKLEKPLDNDQGSSGRGLPKFVFPAHGQGWGVTPSPDRAYTIKFRYFKNPDDVVNATDIVTIPTRFDYVIISGGLYHMSLFKDNAEKTAMVKAEFLEGLGDMTRQLLTFPRKIDDTRIEHG